MRVGIKIISGNLIGCNWTNVHETGTKPTCASHSILPTAARWWRRAFRFFRRGCHPSRTIDNFELIFVRQGRLMMGEEDQRFEIAAGQTLILWPGRRHLVLSLIHATFRFTGFIFRWLIPGKAATRLSPFHNRTLRNDQVVSPSCFTGFWTIRKPMRFNRVKQISLLDSCS